jgi:amidase
MDDLLDRMDATGLAGEIRAGRVSAREVLEAVLRRLDARNPAINAVVARRDDAARADVDAGRPDGVLSGVPFVVKDLGATVAGMPAHQREPALRRRGRDRGL